MLTAYSTTALAAGARAAPAVTWIDLFMPTEDERAGVERGYGLRLPSREELSEVELSSRLSERNGTLFLSMPAAAHMSDLGQAPSPLGFVLSERLLVTIRYAHLHAFETMGKQRSGDDGRESAAATFAALVGGMLESSADLIERIAGELDGVSRAIFTGLGSRNHVSQSNDELRRILIAIGDAGERLSRIRDSVLGLQRIVPFVASSEQDWIPDNVRAHLRTTQADLAALTEYEAHLSGKVQFLLDAVLGFINTRQNDIFQVLTAISILGIPPTLVASIYGMNFRNMPELAWEWGYPLAIVLILLSAIVPILWFKWRRWI